MSSHDSRIQFGNGHYLAWALLHFPVWLLVIWSILGSAVAAVPISLILHFAHFPTDNFPHYILYLGTFGWMSVSTSLMFIIARNRKFKPE